MPSLTHDSSYFVVAYTFRFDVVCIHLGSMFMLSDDVFVVVFVHDKRHSNTVDIISFRVEDFRYLRGGGGFVDLFILF